MQLKKKKNLCEKWIDILFHYYFIAFESISGDVCLHVWSILSPSYPKQQFSLKKYKLKSGSGRAPQFRRISDVENALMATCEHEIDRFGPTHPKPENPWHRGAETQRLGSYIHHLSFGFVDIRLRFGSCFQKTFPYLIQFKSVYLDRLNLFVVSISDIWWSFFGTRKP